MATRQYIATFMALYFLHEAFSPILSPTLIAKRGLRLHILLPDVRHNLSAVVCQSSVTVQAGHGIAVKPGSLA
jgi:hypothetical protein